MSTKSRRHGSAEEKLSFLEEACQSSASISEVCRRHQLAPGQFYAWERQARQGALSALRNSKPGRKGPDPTQLLQAQILRLQAVVAELSAENLDLKKGFWPRGCGATESGEQDPRDPDRPTGAPAHRPTDPSDTLGAEYRARQFLPLGAPAGRMRTQDARSPHFGPAPDAFREAVNNAVQHRDYTRRGAVYIQFHPDHLFIANPGGFPEGITLDNLLVHEPKPRNPRLAEAFRRIELVERTGRGIDARASLQEHLSYVWRALVEDEEWILRCVGSVTLQKTGLIPNEGGLLVKDAVEAFLKFTNKPMIASRDAVTAGLAQACKDGLVGIGRGGSPSTLQSRYVKQSVPLDPTEDGLWIIPPFEAEEAPQPVDDGFTLVTPGAQLPPPTATTPEAAVRETDSTKTTPTPPLNQGTALRGTRRGARGELCRTLSLLCGPGYPHEPQETAARH